MKSSIFWEITPCSLMKSNGSFGRTCHLHLHGRRISQARNQCKTYSKQVANRVDLQKIAVCFMLVSS
jgi:hypothetical protein